MKEFTYDTPLRSPRIDRVVVNIGVGEGGDKLMKAEKVLQAVTGRKPSRTVARQANREFAIREGTPIGCRVTLRDEVAEEWLKKAFWVRNNKIPDYSFDNEGNLNFGVVDYTDFPGQKYDPEIGIFGMDVAVVIHRAGARIQKRRLLARRIPRSHRVPRDEAIAFLAKKFSLEVV